MRAMPMEGGAQRRGIDAAYGKAVIVGPELNERCVLGDTNDQHNKAGDDRAIQAGQAIDPPIGLGPVRDGASRQHCHSARGDQTVDGKDGYGGNQLYGRDDRAHGEALLADDRLLEVDGEHAQVAAHYLRHAEVGDL